MPSWEGLGSELGITSAHAIVVVLSAVGIYVAVLVFVRIFGQRVLTAMSTFDVVITVMLGAVAGRVILGLKGPTKRRVFEEQAVGDPKSQPIAALVAADVPLEVLWTEEG